MGEALEIVKTLVSPTEKLTNSVKNAIGIMYEPRHIKKMADAKAYEINTIGKALRENNDVIITYEKGSIIDSLPEFEEFAKRTQYRLLSRELKNQYNIESIIGYAYEDLETESQTTDEDIDEDWIIRLFNIAKDVSNEDMQFVWGKILAGEIKCPGSFSLRTLDVVRNLSQKEAKTFQKILPLIIVNDEDYFIISKASIYEKYGVTYDDIMLLDECGLVVSNGTVSLTIPISNDSVIAHNKICYCV